MIKYDICVVGGAGYVGLPLSIIFADRGKSVMIYDINEKSLDTINNGMMPFIEAGAEELLKKTINKTLFTSSNVEVISHAKYVIIIIGTPVDEHLNPNYHAMKTFFNELVPYLNNDQIIILRSTVYPGTTKKVRNLLKKTYPDIEICFCCERILEGKALEELVSLPQIISGFDDDAISRVSNLFRTLTNDIIVIDSLEAELTKLFCNSWRYIKFATANQFYMIARELGADFYNIYNAMTYNYPRTKDFPKAGFAAGPCLFKDTMQLSASTNNTFFLGHSAMLINEGLPNFIIAQLKKQYKIDEMTVGILGMAFKSESDDKRESLSYKLKKILEMEANAVLCSDVYIKEDGFVSEEELIDRSDIIIIGAPHIKYGALDCKNKILVDVWNYIKND